MSTQRYYSTPSHQTNFPSSSHLTTTRYWKYDVFLSFRGEDTRKGFTDHLYAALKRKGIFTFRDNEELERGKSISPELLKAIEESRFVIVILSRNYASSTWCLDELAKAVDCIQMGLSILPVFHYVDPSEVRKQTGSFGKDFLKHEGTFKDKKEKVQKWRDALSVVANLAGWHLKDGPESEVVEDIVGTSLTVLNQTILSESKGLVGMDSRIREMLSFLEIGLLDIRIIGIWGMKGIGKTTLARVVAKRIRAQFEGYSYLANVREATEKLGTEHLKEQLLSDLLKGNVKIQNIDREEVIWNRLRNKRALIILDDVDEVEKVEALCDPNWFGPGSRIIITSTDEHVLRTYEDKTYEVKLLSDSEALQLFSWRSFKKDQVGEGFLKVSEDVLTYAKGLPLAIKVLGSFLYKRPLKAWLSELDRLKEHPVEEIIDVLKVSFDGLSKTEKRVFLDIACFFKGVNKDRVIRILETSHGYLPEIDIDVLMDKSLVTLFGRKLWMHDLIQELGWEIVRREHERPGKRSRLWLPKDIIHVLGNSKGTTAVESIFLDFPKREEVLAPKKKEQEVHLKANAFSKMDNLRLLKIRNGNFHGNIEYLSSELQFLEWHECPLNSLPSDFESDKLVELNLYSSRIEQLWEGEKCWSMLQFIDLSDSEYLTMTPNFNEVPNLETLVLQGCTRLVEVHSSIGFLKKLIFLNMRNCKSVESLPPFIILESLKSFTLSACSSLKKFPDIEGNMESLLELHLDGTAIEELPPSLEHLTGLTFLNLGECKNLLRLPETIQYLTSLKSLVLAGCSQLNEIPENLNRLKFLENLDLSGTAIRESSSIAGLSSLTALNLSDCNLMEGALLNGLASLCSLEILRLCGNNFVHLPESISHLSKLQYLDVSNCGMLQLMPRTLPSSVQHVDALDCTSLKDFPNQFTVWGSAASGITTFNCLISSKNQDFSEPKSFWSPVGNVFCGASHEHQERKSMSGINFPNEYKVWGSAISGCTTFNCLISSKNQEYSEHKRLWSLSAVPGSANFSWVTSDEHQEWKPHENYELPTEMLRKQFELLDYRSAPIQAVGDLEIGIPEWFGHMVSRDLIQIELSQDWMDDRNWMGVALCAAFSVKGTQESEVEPELMNEIESVSKTCNVYHWTLGIDEFIMKPDLRATPQTYGSFITCGSPLFCVWYIPCLSFPHKINESSIMWASFKSTNPCMEVQKCGIRLLYRQDVAGFIQAFMQYYEGGCQDEPTFESGWLKLVDKILRWERLVLNSEKSSVILPRKNFVSILPRYLEGTNTNKFFSFYLNGIPAWFRPEVRASVEYKLPENLHKSKKWIGFALCASLAADQRKAKQHYRFSCQLQVNNTCVIEVCCTNKGQYHSNKISDDKHLLWVVYVPRAQFQEQYYMGASSSSIRACFRTYDPDIEVEIYGFRVVYQQDLQGLVQTIDHCISRASGTPFEYYNELVVRLWLNDITLRSPKFEATTNVNLAMLRRNLETQIRTNLQVQYHAIHYYKFSVSGSPEWLNPKAGSSVSTELPPDLLNYYKKWMGFAVCVSLAVDRNELGGEEYCFSCRFQIDGIDFSLPDFSSPATYECQLWVIYLPRELFAEQYIHSSCIRTTIRAGSPGVEVKTCGFRILYEKDLEDFVQTVGTCFDYSPLISFDEHNNETTRYKSTPSLFRNSPLICNL